MKAKRRRDRADAAAAEEAKEEVPPHPCEHPAEGAGGEEPEAEVPADEEPEVELAQDPAAEAPTDEPSVERPL